MGLLATSPASSSLDDSPPARHRRRNRGHIAGLDGVRAIAIAAVFAIHSIHRATPILNTAHPLDGAIYSLAGLGWAGVDLFFVLSGFLITGILLDARGGPDYFRAFYTRRVLRIFPLYYASAIAVIVLLPRLIPPGLVDADTRIGATPGSWWVWTYLTNIRIAFFGSDSVPRFTVHYWSLAVEEQFYLVWPLLVLALGRRRLLFLCAGVAIGSLALRLGLANVGVSPHFLYYATFARLDPLALGAAIACVVRADDGLRTLAKYARPTLIFSTAALLLLIVGRDSTAAQTVPMATIGFSAVAWASAAALVIVLASPRISQLLEWQPIAYVGRRSYAIYIIHPVIIAALRVATRRITLPEIGSSAILTQIAFCLLCAVVVLFVAEASWRLLESPMLALKRYFPMPQPGNQPHEVPSGEALVEPGAS